MKNIKVLIAVSILIYNIGTPCRIRICNSSLRRRIFYPIELTEHLKFGGPIGNRTRGIHVTGGYVDQLHHKTKLKTACIVPDFIILIRDLLLELFSTKMKITYFNIKSAVFYTTAS